MTSVDDDFTGLRALYINCTLKRSPERSHTQGLMPAYGNIRVPVTGYSQ